MSRPEKLQYKVIPSSRLTNGQHADINRLIRSSIVDDFPKRSHSEYDYLVQESARNRTDPNRAVGRSFNTAQTFSHSVMVAATDADAKLVACLPVADNASSQTFEHIPKALSDIAGVAIRQAKLHWTDGTLRGKSLITSRWMWLGLCAMDEGLKSQVREQADKAFTVVDGLILAAGLTRDERQPVSAYPWFGERAWMDGLRAAGLESTGLPLPPKREAYVAAFGPDAHTVTQSRWIAPSVAHVLDTIAAKDTLAYQAVASAVVHYERS